MRFFIHVIIFVFIHPPRSVDSPNPFPIIILSSSLVNSNVLIFLKSQFTCWIVIHIADFSSFFLHFSFMFLTFPFRTWIEFICSFFKVSNDFWLVSFWNISQLYIYFRIFQFSNWGILVLKESHVHLGVQFPVPPWEEKLL